MYVGPVRAFSEANYFLHKLTLIEKGGQKRSGRFFTLKVYAITTSCSLCVCTFVHIYPITFMVLRLGTNH